MSTSASPTADRATATARVAPVLAGIGTATPSHRWPQGELAELQARLWGLEGEALERWWRIVDGSGIEHRAIVADPAELPRLGTEARMERFARHAPPLAASASAQAMRTAGVDPASVTDLVIATCTGFRAPGLAIDLIDAGGVGLSPSLRTLQLGFMGCFGGVAALRAARSIAGDDPEATVLVVCVELCSLHLRHDLDPQNLVASALFADGAAAAVVRGAAHPPNRESASVTLGRGRSLAMIEHRDSMTWRITDHGFAMTLSRDVPGAVRRRIGEFLGGCDRAGDSARRRLVLPHPGGPGILEAVEAGCAAVDPEFDRRGLAVASRVLQQHGNLSSAAILFVLEEALRSGLEPPAELVAFGPGLAIDAIELDRSSRRLHPAVEGPRTIGP